jgi:hypothetical protein
MKYWEYLIVNITSMFGKCSSEVWHNPSLSQELAKSGTNPTEQFNYLGSLGWELCRGDMKTGSLSTFIFKREKQT